MVSTRVGNGLEDDDRVVTAIRPRLRNCANQGLKQEPSQQGTLVVIVTLAPNGSVTSTSVAQNTGLGESVAQCMSRALRTGQFPASGARTIMVTITATRN